FVELRFGGAGLRVPVVAPGHQRRQGHEDGLGAAAGLQSEYGAAIVDEVEFHVAPAAIELELPLAFAPGHPAPPRGDGGVSRQVRIAHAAQEIEAAGKSPLAEVVEEQSADPARLA